jgi:hypothetical protein
MRAGRVWKILIAILVVGLGLVVLIGCESPAAQRELARAERIQAEAQAYERERAADAAAYAERASVRQMERDAAHERTLEILPFVLAIGGGVVVICLGLFAWWDLRSQRRALPAPLEQQPGAEDWAKLAWALEQRERALWHALATMARRQQGGAPATRTEENLWHLVNPGDGREPWQTNSEDMQGRSERS